MNRTVQDLVGRAVRIDMDKDAYGQPWAIRCDECPMKPHTDALGQAAPICASGLMTNLQGAVPVHMCKHYAKESIRNDSGALTVECSIIDKDLPWDMDDPAACSFHSPANKALTGTEVCK